MLKKKLVTKHYHLTYPIFLVLFLVIGLFITLSQSQKSQELNSNAATTNCSINSSQLTQKTQEQMMLTEVNQYRKGHNLGALAFNATLKQAAAWQSTDMMAHNKMSHTDSLGRTPDIRLSNCGYDITEGYGEAIAEGTADPTVILLQWEADPAHNQILLTSRYNIAGIDLEIDPTGRTTFWTMDFGTAKAVTPPFVPPTTTPVPGVTSPYTPPTYTPGPSQLSPTTVPTGNSSSPSNAPSTAPSGISNAPSNAVSPTIGPITNDMIISVSVQLFGIGQGGNSSPKHLTRKITAFVYGSDPTPVSVGNAFLVYDGTNYFKGIIHLGKMSQGSYFVKLVGDNTLQVLAHPEFQTLTIGQTNVIPPVTLYQGDMDGNNTLDINDYNVALPCFQDKRCPNASLIDFNDDGITDVRDYNLMLQSFETLHGN